MTVILLALASGALFYLGQGLDNVWQLAWIAPVALLWLAHGNAPRWQLFMAGVAAFAWGQGYLFQCYWSLSPFLVLRIVVPLCLLFGACLLFARMAQRRLTPFAALFAFPAGWAATEYVLGLLAPDGPFTSMAYSQVSFPAGIQIAALFGYPAVTFVLCLFANAAALLLRRRRAAAGAGLAICALALGFGVVRLQQPQGPTVRVAALADSGKRIESWRATTSRDQQAPAAAYAAALRALDAKGRIDIAAIPEGAIMVRQAWRDAVLAPLAAAARDTDTLIVAGTAAAKPVLNRAYAFYPDAAPRHYDKRHPLRPLETEVAGTAPGLLGGRRAMAICKDMDFPDSIRGDVASGIGLMIVPASDFTRDGWIHARMAILRGVENGFAVLRTAFNGLETVSDARGRVLASANTARWGMVVLTARVPMGDGPTLYTRIGDVFAWACLLAALGMGAVVMRRI